MFTGIIEETGRFAGWEDNTIKIEANLVLEDAEVGQSISVDGCCLTVTTIGENFWTADIADETRKRTTLAKRNVGDKVNLERAARIGDRLGGHIVQGHVDGVGEVIIPAPDMRVHIPKQLLRYVVEKGSITVNGVSLTIVSVEEDGFTVTLIPHTLEATNLGDLKVGDLVNLEVDVVAKYAERLAVYLPHYQESKPA